MPVIGYTDVETLEDTPPDYPLWAMVKMGAPKPKNAPGRNLDYFRFDWKDEDAKDKFLRIFGTDDIRSMFIETLQHDVDSVFDSWYRKYTSNNVLQIKCDGCTIVRALNKDLLRGDAPCICDPEKRENKDSKMCQHRGYLYFTIPELVDAMGYVGQFILQVGSLDYSKRVASVLLGQYKKVGTLVKHPFLLQRIERTYDKQKEDGTPVQYKQWDVELVPPSDKVLSRIHGLVYNNVYLNAPEIEILPTANPQLPAGQEDIVEFDDFVDHRAPVISQDALSKIDKFVSVATGFTLENLLNTLGEISSDTILYADIDQITYEQISFHLLEQMARCAVPFKVNSMGYDKGKKRHYIPFMVENVLMFTRDKFREPLTQSGMNDDAIKAFVNHFDKKDINFMNDLEIPLEELPLIYVSQVIDNETGEHKYFEVEHVRIADSMVNQETGSLDDIPF